MHNRMKSTKALTLDAVVMLVCSIINHLMADGSNLSYR